MESNACAMFRWRLMVRVRNTVVIGLAGGPPDGCWATRHVGRASASIAAYAVFMHSPGKVARDGCVIVGRAPASRNGARGSPAGIRKPGPIAATLLSPALLGESGRSRCVARAGVCLLRAGAP